MRIRSATCHITGISVFCLSFALFCIRPLKWHVGRTIWLRPSPPNMLEVCDLRTPTLRQTRTFTIFPSPNPSRNISLPEHIVPKSKNLEWSKYISSGECSNDRTAFSLSLLTGQVLTMSHMISLSCHSLTPFWSRENCEPWSWIRFPCEILNGKTPSHDPSSIIVQHVFTKAAQSERCANISSDAVLTTLTPIKLL